MASIGPFPSSSTASFANLSTASLPSSTATSSSSSSTVSSSSSQSCVVPISISSLLAERIAQNVLAEMRKNFRCSYDILPPIWNVQDVSLKDTILEQYYIQYGPRFLTYLQYQVYLEQIKDIRNKILGSLAAVGRLQDGETSGSIAIANYGGIGEAGEPATYAAAKCALADVPVIRITAVSSATLKIKPEHTFLLLGVQYSEFAELKARHGGKIRTIHTILEGFPHGVLFDPYLKLVFPLSRLQNSMEGLEFSRYTNVRSLTLVKETFTKSKEQWQAIEKEANEICHIMQGKKSTSKTPLFKAEQKVREMVMRDIDRELKRIFPGLNWKKNDEEGKIWFTGSPGNVEQVCRILKANGMLVKELLVEGFRLYFVENLDLMKLHLLKANPFDSSHIPVQTSIHYPPFPTSAPALTSCPSPSLRIARYLPATSNTRSLHRQASALTIMSSQTLESTASHTSSSTVSLPSQTNTSSNTLESISSLPPVRTTTSSRTPSSTTSLPSKTTTSSQTVELTSSLPYVRTTASSRSLGSMVSLPPLVLSSHGSVSNLTLPRLVTGNVPAATGNEGKESRQ